MIDFDPSAESAISRVGFFEESEMERKYLKIRVYNMALMSTNLNASHTAEQVLAQPTSCGGVRS